MQREEEVQRQELQGRFREGSGKREEEAQRQELHRLLRKQRVLAAARAAEEAEEARAKESPPAPPPPPPPPPPVRMCEGTPRGIGPSCEGAQPLRVRPMARPPIFERSSLYEADALDALREREAAATAKEEELARRECARAT